MYFWGFVPFYLIINIAIYCLGIMSMATVYELWKHVFNDNLIGETAQGDDKACKNINGAELDLAWQPSSNALKDGRSKSATHITHGPADTASRRKKTTAYRPDEGVLLVFRARAGPRRARRVELPLRRHPRHVRSARLHGLGPDLLSVRKGQDAVHTDGVLLVHRRGA